MDTIEADFKELDHQVEKLQKKLDAETESEI